MGAGGAPHRTQARKPDFDAFIAPQMEYADICISVLPTQLMEDDKGKILRVKLIQAEGKEGFDPAYLFDEVCAREAAFERSSCFS